MASNVSVRLWPVGFWGNLSLDAVTQGIPPEGENSSLFPSGTLNAFKDSIYGLDRQ